MQRVSALLPSWERPKPPPEGTAKPKALNKVFSWADKLSSPKGLTTTPNPANHKVGREVYWPTSLDRECEKAARILKSFCTDGFLAQEHPQQPASRSSSPTAPAAPPTPSTPKLLTKKIPPRIIQDAVGLAIFSCMRSGLWMSGSGGSGILIARKADGTWSPPAGILLHTAALGFVLGVDIYDCVLVINSVPALEMFTRARVTLGTDVSLTVGPLIAAGLTDNDTRWKELNNTVLTYLKARGQHRGVQLDGSMVTERGNENEGFYSGPVDVLDILAGNVRKSIPEIKPLFEVIKAAEGRTDFDNATMEMLSLQPAPGDAEIETPNISPVSPRPSFGIPNNDDPDPYGVIALEMAGLEIREAGTKMRPTSTQFEYSPSPTSPVFPKLHRGSVDTYLTRSNRGSYLSTRTQATSVTDTGTQTDVVETPDTALSPNHSDDGKDQRGLGIITATTREPEEVDYTKVDMSVIRHLSQESLDHTVATIATQTPTPTPRPQPPAQSQPKPSEQPLSTASQPEACETDNETKSSSIYPEDERDEDADDEDDEEDDDEEPVIFEVATTQPTRAKIMATQVTQVIQAKGALVTIPKRIPPPLPERSPARTSRASKSEFGDVSMISSPLRQSYQSGISEAVSEAKVAIAREEASGRLEGTTTDDKDGSEGHAHHRSSSVCTASEKRFSMNSTPESPPTPQATEHASSADDSDHGPQTPRPEDDFHRESVNGTLRHTAVEEEMKLGGAAHIEPTVIPVA